jgi:glycosyltransferase involved in cell wall biosynthesis
MSRPKRIACFLPDLGGGGAERVMLASIRDLVARGHAVDLIVMNRDGALMPLLPSAVRVIDLATSRIRSTVVPLVRYLRREDPDALHAQMWPMTVVAILAHRLARSKARLMVSDQSALSPHMKTPAQARALAWTARHFYPKADVRVMCAADAAADLARVSGLDAATVEIITNPVEPPAVLASNPKVEALWGDAEGRIINCGSLKHQKNQALLLRAFAQAAARPRSKLMILGEGPLRGELETLARELGVADRVIMPGFDIDPWPYLASAEMFVLSSDYEGFPLVLAEAMYAGLRLVSTDCPTGPAELTDRGRFGELVACGDAAALAAAIDRGWKRPHDPAAQRARAVAMAGPAQIARYTELLTAESR